MNLNIFIPVDDPEFNTLMVSTDFCYGGMSYFTGQVSRKGIHVHVRPVNRDGDRSFSFPMFDDRAFKFCVRELSRNSKKKVAAVHNVVRQFPQDRIVNLWKSGQFKELAEQVTDAAEKVL